MIIACPNCQTKYNLPESKLAPGGSKVKCARCAHVFLAKPPAMSLEDTAEQLLQSPEAKAPAAASDAFDKAFEDAAAPAAPAQRPAPAPRPAPQPEPEEEATLPGPGRAPEPDTEEEPPAPRQEEEVDSSDFDKAFAEDAAAEAEGPSAEAPAADFSLAPAKKQKGRKGPMLGLAAVLALAVLVYGAYLLQPVLPFKLPALPFGLPGVRTEAPAPESPASRVKKIVLRNVRQYYVNNEHAGLLFVIEGKALNSFDTPKERISLEATLYDDKGQVIATRQQLCGNTLSQLQLQVQTEADINAGLASDVGILSNNTFLKPGMDTPFMFVFFNTPKNVKEFGVKAVDARDPAQ